MSTASFPLLDAFTQQLRDFNYNAVTNWSRFFNISPAISLFTYNAGDEEVEQKVIDHVGSYGSQLSRILKMLDLRAGESIIWRPKVSLAWISVKRRRLGLRLYLPD